MSVNVVILIGNLTRDVQTRQAGAGTVAEFGLACNRKFKAANGEQRDEVTFVDVSAWGRLGEVVAQYCAKGSLVYVEGRLKLDTWEDKEGGKRSKLTVVAESVQFLDKRQDDGAHLPNRSEDGQRTQPRYSREPQSPASERGRATYQNARQPAPNSPQRTNPPQRQSNPPPSRNVPQKGTSGDFNPDEDLGPLDERF